MKIGTLEGIFLMAVSVIFDIINIVLFLAVVGIVLNSLINAILGCFFILWFMLKAQLSGNASIDDDEEGESDEDWALQQEKDRLRKLYREKQEQAKRVGAEVSEQETAGTAEKVAAETAGREIAETAERVATKTGERAVAGTAGRVATGVTERGAATTAEKVAARTGERVAAGIMGRILGATIIAKLITVLNVAPLWTISTVLLLRTSRQENKKMADEKADAEAIA